jgi:hypothetical protein
MSSIEQNQNDNNPILKAVTAIKTAILQGQYEAAKDVNRVQLALYYAIGRYLALNTRKGVWGTGALQAISGRLRKELPGLRGFSVSSLKNMRLFYEEWSILDAKVKKKHENPSIGIILCKSADHDFVEFVIRDYSKPMGVATYTTNKDMPDHFRKALPDIEELKRLL